MIVADANLIVYRHVEGPLTPLAGAVLSKDPDWRTAAMWRCEMTSALVKMIRGEVLEAADALAAMASAAREMADREVDVPQELAMRSALRYGISAYDAQYIALAEMLDVSCVTADGPLARKTPAVSILLAHFAQ